IAIRYRHNVDIHARGMVATGIVIIEPALTRLFLNLFVMFKVFVDSPYFFFFASIPTILIIYSILIGIIIKERHQKKGRWVFPLIAVLYLVAYVIALFQIHIGLESISKWFVSLP